MPAARLAQAGAQIRRPRPLPAGAGLVIGAVASLGLWAAIATTAVRLIAG